MVIKCPKKPRLLRPPDTTISPSATFESGQEKDVSLLPIHHEGTTSMSFLSLKTLLQEPISVPGVPTLSIQEYPPESNEPIFPDNQYSSKISTLPTVSWKISEAESTTNEKAFKPFWNNSSKEISKELWLPTLTDSQGLDLISFNGCSQSLEQYWTQWKMQPKEQQMTSWKTLWKFLPSLQPATTEAGNTFIATRKVKLILNKTQKTLVQKCLHSHRYFYNKTIEKINKTYEDRKHEFQESPTCVHCTELKLEGSFCCQTHQKRALPWKLNINFINLRNAIVKADSEITGTDEEWQSEVPYDTRQLAVKDAVSAFKSACTNKQRGHIQTFNLSYKSRRMPQQICWLDSNAVKKSLKKPKKKKAALKKVGGRKKKGKKKKSIQPASMTLRLTLFPSRLGEERYIRVRKRQLKRLPETFDSDCKIVKYGKDYYLVYSITQNREPKKEKEDILSLDPGVRTFQTGYSPSGIVSKFGEQQSRQLDSLQIRLDSLRSLKSQCKKIQKHRIRIRCLRTELKIKHMVENLHNQVASHISKIYGTILLPKFSTSVMQIGSSLCSSTKRDLWSLSHYKFQQKLLNLCNRRGSVLYIVEEHYTTKTCGKCGILREVGAAKVYCCTQCTYRTDRDVHGARNILLKHITQHGAN